MLPRMILSADPPRPTCARFAHPPSRPSLARSLAPRSRAPWLAAIVLAASCGAPTAPASSRAPSTAPAPAAAPLPPTHATLAFTHVRVFDGERVVPDATVLVD